MHKHCENIPPLHVGQIGHNEIAEKVKARLPKSGERKDHNVSSKAGRTRSDSKVGRVEDEDEDVCRWTGGDVCDFGEERLRDGTDNLTGGIDSPYLSMARISAGSVGIERVSRALVERVGEHGENQGDAQDPEQQSATLGFTNELVEGLNLCDAGMLVDDLVACFRALAMPIYRRWGLGVLRVFLVGKVVDAVGLVVLDHASRLDFGHVFHLNTWSVLDRAEQSSCLDVRRVR